jgi:type III pantothenate kinase
MILVIDVGNTRLKWAWLDSSGLSPQQAIVHRDVRRSVWTSVLFDQAPAASRVLVCNVAGPGVATALTSLARRKFGIRPEFVTGSLRFEPLTNGYLDPELLGADRWVGLIGAWTRVRSALCVIDAGTAVKVDSVDAAGRHLGGLIVPGIQMMRESLLRGTKEIARAAEQSTPSTAGVLANNTIGAVSRGSVLALAGLADRAVEMIEKDTGVRPRLLITGGDGALMAGTMRLPGEVVPDLVLQGLAAIAAAPTQSPASP